MTPSLLRLVGFDGLGDQGAPMAQAVADSPFELHVWARRAASLGTLDGREHTAHPSPAALAAISDILLLVLRDDDDVDDILHRQGALDALRPGSIVVSHGTGDPQAAVAFARAAAERGIAFLDAPVSGGSPGARQRTLATIVGGDPEASLRARPVFDTFSRSVVHMGGPGSGQVAKLLNNALTMTNLKNAEEVLSLAGRIGVDIDAFRSLLASSSGGSFVMQALGDQITPDIAPHLQGLMRKDIEHFADAMSRLGLDARSLHDRGRAGAEGLLDAVQLVTAARTEQQSAGQDVVP